MSKLADTKHIKALERGNRKLRTELSKSELHERFLETMIDIAERNFNIPIKKKPAPEHQNHSRWRREAQGDIAVRLCRIPQAILLQPACGWVH